MWRPLKISDLAQLSNIAAKVHPGLPEDDAVFAERLQLAPDFCFFADPDLGYCLAHPWKLGQVPKLNSLLGSLAGADCLYIHDVALLPTARGTGLGRKIVEILAEVAHQKGFTKMALTSVSGADPFWLAMGFEPKPMAGLESYGSAQYMIKVL